jgi:hypothetical protein
VNSLIDCANVIHAVWNNDMDDEEELVTGSSKSFLALPMPSAETYMDDYVHAGVCPE